MPLVISVLFFALGSAFVSQTGIWLFFLCQLTLVMGEVFRKQISGTGGFIFMSFLFFGVRPLYIILEQDFQLLGDLFRLYVELDAIHENMFWGTLGIFGFKLGSLFFRTQSDDSETENLDAHTTPRPKISDSLLQWMLTLQVGCLILMYFLATGGRGLYGSSLGAFAYDFPNVMQAVQIFAFVITLERFLQTKGIAILLITVLSATIFCMFTWLMREVSLFRGFYLTGVLIISAATVYRINPRISMLWVMIPITIFLPTFQVLGNIRQIDNNDLKHVDLVEEAFGGRSIEEAYWKFFSSSGDINIFDTFVATRSSEPQFTPFAWSWIYAPLHVIPRRLWSGKPENGITQDISFTYGAPYSPGIAGFFWLDGGSDWWMLLSMTILGGVIGLCDQRTLRIRSAHLQACIIAVLTINAMFLSRFFSLASSVANALLHCANTAAKPLFDPASGIVTFSGKSL